MTAPINDNYQNAIYLNSNSGTLVGSNVDATKQYDFPEYSERGSVWFYWVAANDGVVNFNTYGSNFNTSIASYASSNFIPSDQLATNDDTDEPIQPETGVNTGLESKISFSVVSGGTYYIEVGGYPEEEGDWTLNWTFDIQSPPPTPLMQLPPPPTDPAPVNITIVISADSDSLIVGENTLIYATVRFSDNAPRPSQVFFEVVTGDGELNGIDGNTTLYRTDGMFPPISGSTVLIRATSVYDLSVSAEIEINIVRQVDRRALVF